MTIYIFGLKIIKFFKKLMLFIFISRFECTILIIKELLLHFLHFIFTNIAIFIKPGLYKQIL